MTPPKVLGRNSPHGAESFSAPCGENTSDTVAKVLADEPGARVLPLRQPQEPPPLLDAMNALKSGALEGLRPVERLLVLVFVDSTARTGPKAGLTWVSVPRLADWLGTDPTAVRVALRRLEAKGILTSVQPDGWRPGKDSNHYRVSYPGRITRPERINRGEQNARPEQNARGGGIVQSPRANHPPTPGESPAHPGRITRRSSERSSERSSDDPVQSAPPAPAHTDPVASSILEELGRHAVLAPIATVAFAETLAGRAHAAAIPVDAVKQAIGEAAADASAVPPPPEKLAGMVRKYADRAGQAPRLPRSAYVQPAPPKRAWEPGGEFKERAWYPGDDEEQEAAKAADRAAWQQAQERKR